MSDTKIYFGQCKEFKFEDGGTSLNLSFSVKDLNGMIGYCNEKGYVNLKCTKRKEPSQYGQTHSLVLDTWKPKQNAANNEALRYDGTAQKVTTVSNDSDMDSDIPF
jgi:hypothetical protein